MPCVELVKFADALPRDSFLRVVPGNVSEVLYLNELENVQH